MGHLRIVQSFLATAILVLLLGVAPALAQEQNPTSLWNDFNHYVRIARPDLAQSAARELLDRADNDTLLEVVESGDYRDYNQTLRRARNMETLSETAQELGQRIQQARIERSRESERIRADIERLAKGPRAYQNALERLRAAGQYAAPHLLATLLDDSEEAKRLHPYVLGAIVAIGRPMVYPLSASLAELPPVPLAQVVRALAEIGYPRALPYIKEVLEIREFESATRQKIASAYEQLAASAELPLDAPAAELFLTLGKNLYTAGTEEQVLPGYDSATEKGIVWTYGPDIGLVAIEVPGPIFPDVLSMRAAQRSLQLDPTLDAALSTWLAGNLRRENRLSAGAEDLSYRLPRPAMFYAKAAGPLRQHDVLDTALDDGDTTLALDAIEALAATAGTEALVNRQGTSQPLLRALAYPDRRVRFHAAFALAAARPESPFPGSFRVVPVLAEAARQSPTRFAMAISSDAERVNKLKAMLRELGFQPVGGPSLTALADFIGEGPGVDLVLVDGGAEKVASVLQQSEVHYKLAAVPVLATVSSATQIELNRRFHDEPRLTVALRSNLTGDLQEAVHGARTRYAGDPIEAEEAKRLALRALDRLYEIALGSPEVFNVIDALPSLVGALDDDRHEIVVETGRILALIGEPKAQRALAETGLDNARSDAQRVALLESLARSANSFGNHLPARQTDGLLDLVQESHGDLALAASQAHGALTLPTANVVQMIAGE